MKTCIKCGIGKPLEDFAKDHGGRRNDCKPCNNALRRERYRKNHARELAHKRAYYRAKRENILATLTAWVEGNSHEDLP